MSSVKRTLFRLFLLSLVFATATIGTFFVLLVLTLIFGYLRDLDSILLSSAAVGLALAILVHLLRGRKRVKVIPVVPRCAGCGFLLTSVEDRHCPACGSKRLVRNAGAACAVPRRQRQGLGHALGKGVVAFLVFILALAGGFFLILLGVVFHGHPSPAEYPLAFLAAGVLLVSGSMFLAFLVHHTMKSRTRLSHRVPRCPNCNYLLIGLEKNLCPECGQTFPAELLRWK